MAGKRLQIVRFAIAAMLYNAVNRNDNRRRFVNPTDQLDLHQSAPETAALGRKRFNKVFAVNVAVRPTRISVAAYREGVTDQLKASTLIEACFGLNVN